MSGADPLDGTPFSEAAEQADHEFMMEVLQHRVLDSGLGFGALDEQNDDAPHLLISTEEETEAAPADAEERSIQLAGRSS